MRCGGDYLVLPGYVNSSGRRGQQLDGDPFCLIRTGKVPRADETEFARDCRGNDLRDRP